MPGFLKIGRTKDLASRISSLSNTTALPLPFTCSYAAKVADAAFVEQQIHLVFATHRVSNKREFFTVPLASAIAAIRMVSVQTVIRDQTVEAKVSKASAAAYESVEDVSGPLVLSKEEALEDLKALLGSGMSIASQEELARRWKRSSSTVSEWITGWETIGVIPARRATGRCKQITIAA